jgi:catechol 2,3-dioxygenase-like lactoylglutathione lyase family enzyme
MITGAPPKTWAMGIPEFLITDLGQSLAFWTGVLGFRIACSRPEQSFVCLEHPDGAQIMMYPRDVDWEVGAMERPFRRGVVFRVQVSDVDAMVRAVIGARLPFCVQRANAVGTGATGWAARASFWCRIRTASS